MDGKAPRLPTSAKGLAVHPEIENEPKPIRRTIRKHRKLFALPLVLGAVAAGALAASSSSSFSSTASLWVDSAPPAQSSEGASAVSIQPAMQEQTILNELLATRSFAAGIVHHSVLSKELGSNATSDTAAAKALGLMTKISSAVPGPQVLQISL